MNIKNRDEIVKELAEILMQFDLELRRYQQDVYLYYDEETQIAKLDVFDNVGGNSWVPDNHFTVYSNRDIYRDIWDFYGDDVYEPEDFSRLVDMETEELIKEVKRFVDDEDDEVEISAFDFRDYINENKREKLEETYKKDIYDLKSEYEETAKKILEEFEKELAYEAEDEEMGM